MRDQIRWGLQSSLRPQHVRCQGQAGRHLATQNIGLFHRLFRRLIQRAKARLRDRPHAPTLEACDAHGDPNDLPVGQRPRKPLPQNRADTSQQPDCGRRRFRRPAHAPISA